MNGKRLLFLLMAVVMILSLTACQNGEEENIPQESTTKEVVEKIAEEYVIDVTAVNETTTASEDVTDTETTALSEDKTQGESSVLTTKLSDNPADWSKKKIVSVYKNAAKKSHSSVVSDQKIQLKDISVNNGQFEGFFDFIMPIMSKLLEKNSKQFDGITGGYNNLTASDIASAKAYKSGKNIAVEMVMHEQLSGPSDDALGGSVGHAISAVGDIGSVVNQLKDLGLPLELSDKDTKIYYTNPVLKVLINKGGEIVSGTWKYTVEIRMDNYKAFGKTVENTSVVMDNTITVNGGFKK